MVFILLDLPGKPYQNRYVYALEDNVLVYINIVIRVSAYLTDDAKRQIVTLYSTLYEKVAYEECSFYSYNGLVNL